MAAQLLSFTIDVGIVAATEVDAFEGALLLGDRIGESIERPAIALDRQDMSGWNG